MMTLSLLIGAIAAYWVYNDARGRGHDLTTALLWSVGTLAALYIFLPLYLLLGRKQPVPPKRIEEVIDVEAVPVEETIKCPMCARRVKDDFKMCPYCGFSLKPACTSCGQELNREWRVCPYCQTPADTK
ncbi:MULTISPECIES: zinc ribbon domain-containing protein [Sporomusa]|jgi:RNA polymerase subunit RPABC4/transcription elongation factor Spt4|uniref:Double zinc ribbon n=1 Tax=Sporomusa sphaeroides DSM 2875 TaxID=1337886 RepID=A0ABP2CEJ9_9FIRM|nr:MULTISPECIES: zinc ribbon domain-containing protein [Sporomusa]OLS54908.1 double zinc ribbon [Sporomusa sphaeroides DSM 2875]CVK21199.1 Double zinc ribbon [Sporomusa sphaeroides DSM 2875]HML32492.1 zinc ribbon domain-containing protein [Sporomusa sphaeroides]